MTALHFHLTGEEGGGGGVLGVEGLSIAGVKVPGGGALVGSGPLFCTDALAVLFAAPQGRVLR